MIHANSNEFLQDKQKSNPVQNSKFKTQNLFKLFFIIHSSLLILASCLHLEPPKLTSHLPFWAVKSDKSTVYIFGSFKYINKDPFPFDKEIENAFNKCKNLAVQLDLNKIAALDLMNRSGVYMDTTKITSVLKDSTYIKLVEIFSKQNMPEKSYRKVKPWLAVQTAEALLMRDAGMKVDYRADKYFLGRAADKKVWELESFDFMYRIMPDEWLKDIQNEYVEYLLFELGEAIREADKLNDAWKIGDTEKLTEFYFNKSERDSNFVKVKECIIERRNRFMTGAIRQYLESSEDFFVVIDIVHLIGENGVLNSLRQDRKYKIEQY